MPVETAPPKQVDLSPNGQPAVTFERGAQEGVVRFTAEDIEKARREEKDKLYPRLEALDTELKSLREEAQRRREAEQAEIQAA